MVPLDDIAPNFLRATNLWPGAPLLARHYNSLAAKYTGNDHGLIDTVKSFVECVCETVLGEYGKTMPTKTPSTTEYLGECLKLLGLEQGPGARELGRILSAHNKLADSLSDMRNANGPIVHGRDGFLDCITSNQSRVFLLTGDSLLGLLIAAHEGTEPDLLHTRANYDRFDHLHERIDRAVSIEAEVGEYDDELFIVIRLNAGDKAAAREFRIEPSRLLYAIDRIAYVDILKSVATRTDITQTIAVPAKSHDIPLQKVSAEPLPVRRSSHYVGSLSRLRDRFTDYMLSVGVDLVGHQPSGGSLIDSLLTTIEANLGVDWAARESLQARMKVAVRRMLIGSGFSDGDADRFASPIVEWLRREVPGLPAPDGNGGAA